MNEERFLQALEEGEIEQAEAILEILKKDIPRTRLLYFEGMVLDAIGEPEEALKKFNMALVLHLSDPSIWLAKARVLQELGRMDMARRSVDRACRLSSTNPAACLLYADILYKMKDHKGAMKHVDEAIEMAPDDPDILTLKGILISILEEDYIKALSFFDKALVSDEEHANAWTNRGVALRKIGDRDGAIYSFQKALMLDEEEKVAKQMLEHMGADDYIIPKRKGVGKKRKSSRRTRYMIDDAPRERRVRGRRKPEFEDEDEDEYDDEEDVEADEEYPDGIDEIDDAWEEADGDEDDSFDEKIEDEENGVDETIDEEIEDLVEDAEDWEDVDDVDEELEELDEIEDIPKPIATPEPPEEKKIIKKGKKKVKKGKKKTKELHLKCPRCGEPFDVKVKGRTAFSCPSCGLSGEIE